MHDILLNVYDLLSLTFRVTWHYTIMFLCYFFSLKICLNNTSNDALSLDDDTLLARTVADDVTTSRNRSIEVAIALVFNKVLRLC